MTQKCGAVETFSLPIIIIFFDFVSVQQKSGGQKRPTTSPAPLIPSSHLHSSVAGQQLVNHVTGNHLPVGASPTGPTPNAGTSGRGPFASALRNLAKQADNKDDECIISGDNTRGGSSASGGGTGGPNNPAAQQQQQQQQQPQQQQQRTSNIESRSGGDSRPSDGRATSDDRTSSLKKRTLSPQPPEKVNHFHFFFWD